MSKIDLSKAKIGDKFRTRNGKIVEYVGENQKYSDDKYEIIDKHGNKYTYFQYGNYLINKEVGPDLVEQVFDEPLDIIERDERRNREMQKFVEEAEKEKQELQRRQEVVELADRIFFSERGNMFSFKDCIEVAEHSVNMINQYLKEGKL